MIEQDRTRELQGQLEIALVEEAPLAIRGGGSRAHFNLEPGGKLLDIAEHQGVIDYEPDELMLRVRAGTPIAELETLLAAENQRFAADIPQPAAHSTIGGAIACGWDGPARPAGLSLRDSLLGCRMLNGRGKLVSFGGQVMKNVAGYDLTRLQAGALGTLGMLLDLSLRLLPRSESEEQRCFEVGAEELPQWYEKLRGLRPLLRASCYCGGQLHLQFSGRSAALQKILRTLGGEAGSFDWRGLRDLCHPFFGAEQLACVYLPRFDFLPGLLKAPIESTLIDWEGARIWVRDADPAALQGRAAVKGGFVRVLRGKPLPASAAAGDWPRRIRTAFDPKGLFNRQIFQQHFCAEHWPCR